MSGHLIVLGTNHLLQGARKAPKSIIDPEYRAYISSVIDGEDMDFVLEEGSDLGPTIAEGIANGKLGSGHYLDIDPSVEMRKALDIGSAAHSHCWNPTANVEVYDYWVELTISEQAKREVFWLQTIQGQGFRRAMLICGHGHVLSMSFRLEGAGYSVEARAYYPEHRLCERKHVTALPGQIVRFGDFDSPPQ